MIGFPDPDTLFIDLVDSGSGIIFEASDTPRYRQRGREAFLLLHAHKCGIRRLRPSQT